MEFLKLLKERRSIYTLGRAVSHSEETISEHIQYAIRETPTAFHSESSRAVILYNEHHDTLWDLTLEALKEVVPSDKIAGTEERIASFKAAFGTILFYEDREAIKALQERFPLYAESFPKWAHQSTGIAQFSAWLALTELNLGASLQHYNPLVDRRVEKQWGIPSEWKLLGQMPFGSIEAPPAPKEYLDDNLRFKIFK